jgi:tetratricopeptide (TPR) repeat protein
MLLVRRTIILVLLFLAVRPSSAVELHRILIGAHASASQNATYVQKTTPPVVDWQQEVSLPDDILYVYYPDRSKPLIFLVSLDASGKVAEVRPIEGLSVYLREVADQIRNAHFSAILSGTTFVLRVKNPLQKSNDDWKAYRTEVCGPATDLSTLYKVASLHIGRPIGLDGNGGNELASRCYKYILDRNPSSVAARWGVADICLTKKESCAYFYLHSLIDSNPEFVEARQRLGSLRSWSEGDDAYVATLDEALAVDIPLAERVALLNSQAFFLNRLDRIDDAIRVIKKLNASMSELQAIYPEATSAYYSQEMDYGLLEEAKGMEEDAINSYRLGFSSIALNRMVPDSVRYELDLDIARVLRRIGDAVDAQKLCDDWKKRRYKLASHSPFIHLGIGDDQEALAGEVDGRWEFSCGDSEKGLQLIQKASKKYPNSSAPYRALAQYYYSIGEIEKAREADAMASRLVERGK